MKAVNGAMVVMMGEMVRNLCRLKGDIVRGRVVIKKISLERKRKQSLGGARLDEIGRWCDELFQGIILL